MGLTRDLCSFRTAVVAEENHALFQRIAGEIPLELHEFSSGDAHQGWEVPDNWRVERALIKKDGTVVFDGLSNALGVGYYSKSFKGTLDWEDLKAHLTTNPDLPGAYMFHCMWQYRPWAADWAFCVPFDTYRTLGPGRYEIDLVTVREPGKMIVAESTRQGNLPNTIVFHSNNCHPHMANDGFAGTAVMIRLFQWLNREKTRHTYRLVIGPEHVGTVFYLRDMPAGERGDIAGGVFAEMMGVDGPFKVASTFHGDHGLDKAFHNAVSHHAQNPEFVPWRMSVGNDETVWEAPGYEVPFIQANRARSRSHPFPEYHSNLDGPDIIDESLLDEFLDVFKKVVFIIENNAAIIRKFDGLICLSSPEYGLYRERLDPAVEKDLPEDSEKWGYLQDCLPRYFDGSMTVLDIAEKHGLPFRPLFEYLTLFERKGLIEMTFTLARGKPVTFESLNEGKTP